MMSSTGNSARAESAREHVRTIFAFGVVALVVGGISAGAAWPHDVTEPSASFCRETDRMLRRDTVRPR